MKLITHWLRVLWWHIPVIGVRDITKDLEAAIAEERPLVLKPGKYRIKS